MKIKRSLILIMAVMAFFVIIPAIDVISIGAETTAEEPIKIGFFSPETDASLSFYAPWSKQAFELGLMYATDNTNATLDGRPFEIKYYNTKGSVTDAATLAVTAIETDGCDILAGGTYSSVAGAIAPIAEEYKKLYFVTPAADAAITGKNWNPYVFRIARNNWHDAKAGVNYFMDTVGAKRAAFLAADYSFGYSGVETMKAVILEKGGSVVSIQYAPLFTTDFSAYLTNLIAFDLAPVTLGGSIDVLYIIWAGDFTKLYRDLNTYQIYNYMNISGAVIDIASMNAIELSFGGNYTLAGGRGLCVYGYELPDNDVNDWMVAKYKEKKIVANAGTAYSTIYGYNYTVPELFAASGFGTAQFIVDVANEVPDLDSKKMINYLESNVTIMTPKGNTRLRPEDHQGLAEMYIGEVWKDNRTDSPTYGYLIAKHVQTLSAEGVAPPIENIRDYAVGEFGEAEATPGFDISMVILAVATTSAIVLARKNRRKR